MSSLDSENKDLLGPWVKAIFMGWEEQTMQVKTMHNHKPKEVAKTDQVPPRGRRSATEVVTAKLNSI